MIKLLNGARLRLMIVNAANIIEVNKQYVDSLNVFPVPDGDTGTNMSLTMQSCAKEVAAVSNNHIADICASFSKGALRGARGNSGVILSQIIKGMAEVLATAQSDEIDIKLFSKSLTRGVDLAYKAVTNPKEGTMLTVIREMAEFAVSEYKNSKSVDELLNKTIAAGEISLAKTPDLLPVLKKAGVIDAGGRGLLIIFKGFYNALVGLEETTLAFSADSTNQSTGGFAAPHIDYSDLADIEFAYCTEFFIVNLKKNSNTQKVDKFREKLCTMGDSVTVVNDSELIKVHVHTNKPGAALTEGLKLGEIDSIKIDNMLEQTRALMGDNTNSNTAAKEELEQVAAKELTPFAIVAVCAGEGLAAAFKDLGVKKVVEGGQTMNPSSEDIALACDSCNAKTVFVLPNNKNIILAAEQAADLAKCNITVIKSTNVPQGISAALNFFDDGEVEEITEVMTASLQEVQAGAVTKAVRNANIDNLKIKEGDTIATVEGSVIEKGDNLNVVTKNLIENLLSRIATPSSITLYYGNNVTEHCAQTLTPSVIFKPPLF